MDSAQSDLIARRYRTGALVGQGGQGRVYAAVDELTGQPVAVKLVPHGRRTPAAAREAAILRGLPNPGVVRLLDEGVDGDEHYLVTELIDGVSFPGPTTAPATPWQDIAGPCRRLLQILGRVHRAGIVHGDLKPANVLVSPLGDVYLLDFGLAHAPLETSPDAHQATVGGTLEFLAPEVLTGRRTGIGSDLFALGVMLFVALSGRSPWPATDLGGLIRARRAAPAPLLDSSGLPEAVARTIAALLSTDSAARPSSAAEALARMGLPPEPIDLALPWSDEGPVLTEVELALAFHGPERVLHLPSDAAAHLLATTGGDRRQVRAELRAWLLAGLARSVDGRLQLTRASLDRLRHQHRHTLTPPTATSDRLPFEQRLVLATLALAGSQIDIRVLAETCALPVDRVAASLSAVVAAGLAAPTPGGGWRDRTAGSALATLSPHRHVQLNARLARALRPGAPGRMAHLLAGGASPTDIVAAARVEARYWSEQGRPGDALATTEIAFQVARIHPQPPAGLGPLAEHYTVTALSAERAPVLAQASWHLQRLARLHQGAHLIALLDASRRALTGHPVQARDQVEALPPLGSSELELWRDAVLVQAARRLPVRDEEAAVASAQQRAERAGDPAALARVAGWLGHLRYRQGRYDEAADLHAQAALAQREPHARIAAILNGASALVEAGRLPEARDRASRALALASERRDPLLEARAWWLVRLVAVRARLPEAADEALADAVFALGDATQGGLVAFDEAVLAWRGGQDALAARLAQRARAGFHSSGLQAPAILAASLAATAGDPKGLDWAGLHFDDVDPDTNASILVQAAALLHRATGSPHWAERARASAAMMGSVDPDRVLDVLSLRECLRVARSERPD